MWPNPQFPVDLVPFTEEVLNGKLHFFCAVSVYYVLSRTRVVFLASLNQYIKIAVLSSKNF